MMHLYDYLPSQNGYKVRLLLALLGQEYEHHNVEIFQGQSHTETFLAMSPGGTIPVLQIAPDTYIAESNAILFYLAQGTDFLPTEVVSVTKVIQWFCFEQNQLESSIGSLRYWTLSDKLDRRDDGTIAMLRQKGEAALAALERGLDGRSYLVDNAYTVADIALFAYTHLANDGGFALERYPGIQAWIERIQNHPRHLHTIYSYCIDPYSVREL